LIFKRISMIILVFLYMLMKSKALKYVSKPLHVGGFLMPTLPGEINHICYQAFATDRNVGHRRFYYAKI
jgi:hypothetical protein